MKDTLKKILNVPALRRSLSVVVLISMDIAALLVGLFGAEYLVGGGDRVEGTLTLVPLLVGGWVVIFAAHDLYDKARTRRDPGALIGAVLSWAGLVVLGSVIYPESTLALGEVLLTALFALILVGVLRLFYEQSIERIYRRGLGRTTAVIMGNTEELGRICQMLNMNSGGYTCVGQLDIEDGHVDFSALRQTLDETGARSVILAGAERLPDEELLDLLRSVRLRGLRMRVVPGAVGLMRTRPVLSRSGGTPLLEVGYPQLDNTQRTLKRGLDVVGSLAGLMLLSPLLFAVAAAIKLDSSGPVLFRQKRAGADEKIFICYMFRSMYEDAERRQAELEARNEADGAVFKIKEDPRITRVGHFIRKWSIDELPQLINVLKGEMSLVGPRPLPMRDFERMSDLHKKRLAAVPGMSGYWQISGRSNLSFDDMVKLDLYYIENWSLSFDIKIILKTIGAVLRREGAY
jgi:exopolysaccharide biosynthesis polyprenyl glycosylphosphotransferase